MTYDNMIAVLQAAKERKTIQFRIANDDKDRWKDAKCPNWDFSSYDYRAKPEATIRPYANEVEFLADMKEHGPYFSCDGSYFMPVIVDNDGVTIIGGASMDYEEMVEYKWQDGHPCGKKNDDE